MEQQTREKLEAAISKGRTRPMLLEQTAESNKARSNLAFLKATQKMVYILKKQGENPNPYLTDDQKEALEKEEITNDLKAKY